MLNYENIETMFKLFFSEYLEPGWIEKSSISIAFDSPIHSISINELEIHCQIVRIGFFDIPRFVFAVVCKWNSIPIHSIYVKIKKDGVNIDKNFNTNYKSELLDEIENVALTPERIALSW